MTVALLVLFAVAWSLLAFGLFVGADHLGARVLGRRATFEWFDHTRWSGRSTPGRRAVTRAFMGLAGVFMGVLAVVLLIALLALALAPLVPDRPAPRPPADAPRR